MADSAKYPKALIKDIAELIDAGMICFLNPDTQEVDHVLGDSYIHQEDDAFQEVYDKVDRWGSFIRIEPPESWQSFKIMEEFIESCIPDDDAVKNRLVDALSKRKPFQNFKIVIDGSRYRQNWFDFKLSRLEGFVTEQLCGPEE